MTQSAVVRRDFPPSLKAGLALISYIRIISLDVPLEMVYVLLFLE